LSVLAVFALVFLAALVVMGLAEWLGMTFPGRLAAARRRRVLLRRLRQARIARLEYRLGLRTRAKGTREECQE
jgi:hypothetical protein